jgi:hypothetical protein
MDSLKKVVLPLTVVGAGSFSAGALAQTMSYGPLAVPTLGGSALIVLAALLALFALRYAKQNQSRGGSLLTVALVVAALSSAGGGLQLISNAEAGMSYIELDSLTGDVVPLTPGSNPFKNITKVKLRINSVNPGPTCTVVAAMNGGGSACEAGLELAPDATCTVILNCGGNGGNGGGAPVT